MNRKNLKTYLRKNIYKIILYRADVPDLHGHIKERCRLNTFKTKYKIILGKASKSI